MSNSTPSGPYILTSNPPVGFGMVAGDGEVPGLGHVPLLLGGVFGGFRERLGAGPAMLGDVEQDAFGPVELFLEIAGLRAAVPLVDVVLGAEAIEPLGEFVD